ncbi:FAD-dependent monooxygenase [Streptacidiphilus anmyonensis]|uniref:FAD-dependent monooxygenase n=1 Tax=Streptacidiphilus anmyonensis TaxID=405782 RepID=UPI0005A9F347|nr:FAD-dependent monooxygenase [Streptacidiphilus anmyonensis]
MIDVDVLVVGAGPVGLTAAAELRRHGVECRIVDALPAPLPYAKAVGVQPRTLEVWDAMGLIRPALDEAVPLLGQLTFVDGRPGPRMELRLPPEVPYAFAALPQYVTEQLLTEHLERFGTVVERGTRLEAVAQGPDGVEATLAGDGRTERVRARYLVGCDGAHSLVRKSAGIGFDGDAFPEQYMLGDVEVDWRLPPGYAVRSTRLDGDGKIGDLLVCIPLPGDRRYRMSMMVPPELTLAQDGAAVGAADRVAHGLGSGRGPDLAQIQAVLDRLSPEPTTASALRWSSTFRISHRLADRYREGRLLLAGDAAHIHPPTGAQGMNTGVQDAYNLAWKLALTVRGVAAGGLLDSYDAERHPVGEEVVGRTVRHARAGYGDSGEDGMEAVLLREAQLLVGYPDSPLVEPGGPEDLAAGGPAAGDRAPDCPGLVRDLAAYPQRLFDLLRSPDHTLLLYAGPGHATGCGAERLQECAAAADRTAHGLLTAYVVLAQDVPDDARPAGLRPPRVRDLAGGFARAYGARDGEVFLVRPDGYLAGRFHPADPDRLTALLRRAFA